MTVNGLASTVEALNHPTFQETQFLGLKLSMTGSGIGVASTRLARWKG